MNRSPSSKSNKTSHQAEEHFLFHRPSNDDAKDATTKQPQHFLLMVPRADVAQDESSATHLSNKSSSSSSSTSTTTTDTTPPKLLLMQLPSADWTLADLKNTKFILQTKNTTATAQNDDDDDKHSNKHSNNANHLPNHNNNNQPADVSPTSLVVEGHSPKTKTAGATSSSFFVHKVETSNALVLIPNGTIPRPLEIRTTRETTAMTTGTMPPPTTNDNNEDNGVNDNMNVESSTTVETTTTKTTTATTTTTTNEDSNNSSKDATMSEKGNARSMNKDNDMDKDKATASTTTNNNNGSGDDETMSEAKTNDNSKEDNDNKATKATSSANDDDNVATSESNSKDNETNKSNPSSITTNTTTDDSNNKDATMSEKVDVSNTNKDNDKDKQGKDKATASVTTNNNNGSGDDVTMSEAKTNDNSEEDNDNKATKATSTTAASANNEDIVTMSQGDSKDNETNKSNPSSSNTTNAKQEENGSKVIKTDDANTDKDKDIASTAGTATTATSTDENSGDNPKPPKRVKLSSQQEQRKRRLQQQKRLQQKKQKQREEEERQKQKQPPPVLLYPTNVRLLQFGAGASFLELRAKRPRLCDLYRLIRDATTKSLANNYNKTNNTPYSGGCTWGQLSLHLGCSREQVRQGLLGWSPQVVVAMPPKALLADYNTTNEMDSDSDNNETAEETRFGLWPASGRGGRETLKDVLDDAILATLNEVCPNYAMDLPPPSEFAALVVDRLPPTVVQTFGRRILQQHWIPQALVVHPDLRGSVMTSTTPLHKSRALYQPRNTVDGSYAANVSNVARLVARQLMRQRSSWPADLFWQTWEMELPGVHDKYHVQTRELQGLAIRKTVTVPVTTATDKEEKMDVDDDDSDEDDNAGETHEKVEDMWVYAPFEMFHPGFVKPRTTKSVSSPEKKKKDVAVDAIGKALSILFEFKSEWSKFELDPYLDYLVLWFGLPNVSELYERLSVSRSSSSPSEEVYRLEPIH